MTNQLKSKIYLYLLVPLLLLPNIAFALDESGPELIWKIGDDEAPPNYTKKAFDEFDCDRPFNSDYYVHKDPCSKFPYEINDGEFTQVNIHYNLTYEEITKDANISEIYMHIPRYTINITTTSDDGKIHGDQGEIFVDNTSIGVGRGAIEVYENSNHIISFGEIEGYNKPDLISVKEITKDVNISGIYVHIPRYIINITTKPVDGDIEVNDVFKGKGSFEDEYYKGTNLTVSFGEVGDCFVGYKTPESLHITVDSNKCEVVYYTKIPGRTISIITVTEDDINVNGPIYVDGTLIGRGGVELECRSDRLHEIFYDDCEEYYDNERKKPKYITPPSETVNITKSNYIEGIYGKKKYPPIAKIIPVEPETALYEDVVVNAGASYDMDGHIVRYIWDFSDGTAEGEVTTHRFTTTGEKNIKLTVIDNDGDQSTDKVNVIVKRKPIVKLTKINNTRIGIAIFNPMIRPADPHKNPAAVSVDTKVEVSSRIGVTMSNDGLFHCNLDQGEKFEKEINMECEESYDVWVEYTYRFQDEDELRSSRTNILRMPAKPGGGKTLGPGFSLLDILSFLYPVDYNPSQDVKVIIHKTVDDRKNNTQLYIMKLILIVGVLSFLVALLAFLVGPGILRRLK